MLNGGAVGSYRRFHKGPIGELLGAAVLQHAPVERDRL
jgi:hypothetical protein